jgi:hypothetical protein
VGCGGQAIEHHRREELAELTRGRGKPEPTSDAIDVVEFPAVDGVDEQPRGGVAAVELGCVRFADRGTGGDESLAELDHALTGLEARFGADAWEQRGARY